MALQTQKMVKAAAKIKDVISNGYGNLVTVTNYGETVYNEYGEAVNLEPITSDEYAVSNNYLAKNYTFESSGRIPDSSVSLIFDKDSTIKGESIVTMEDVDYKVISLERLKAADVLLGYQVTLGKK